MVKRIFDIIFSLFGLLVFLPFGVIISLLIVFDSKGGVFFRQVRVGRDNKDFRLWKFRTMQPDSDKKGLITVGGRDARITKIGYFLRRYKLDEVPQLLNIFTGDMSFVGPRPEVRKYVDQYSEEQLKVLSVKPGLTDFASLEYINENEILAKSSNPEETYLNEIMPAKLVLCEKYIKKKNFITDLKIIFKTIGRIIR